jgi:hypothetical protein
MQNQVSSHNLGRDMSAGAGRTIRLDFIDGSTSPEYEQTAIKSHPQVHIPAPAAGRGERCP